MVSIFCRGERGVEWKGGPSRSPACPLSLLQSWGYAPILYPHGRATLKALPTPHHPPSPLRTNLTFIFVDVADRRYACQMMATTTAARATDPTAKRIPAKRSQNILRFVIFSGAFASILTL